MARDLWCTWKPGLRCEIIALEASSDWARATTASKRQGMKLWNNATLAIQEKELPCLWRPILPWHPTLKPSTSYVASPTNQGFHYSNPCLSQRSTLSHSNSNEKKNGKFVPTWRPLLEKVRWRCRVTGRNKPQDVLRLWIIGDPSISNISSIEN